MLRSSALFRHYPTRSSTALSQLRLSPCLLSCHLNDNNNHNNNNNAAAKRSFHSQVLSSIHQQQSSSHQQQQNECAQVPPVTTTTTCQLYFGPRNNPITLNNITSVHQLKQRAGQWLNVQDLSKIRLVRLPPQTRTSAAAASKSSSSTKNVVELTETEKLLSGLMRPPIQYMLDEHVDHSSEQSSSAVLNELNGRDVQVLVEMPFKIRNALYTDGPYDIYVHDIYDVNDLSRALELYAPWTHRMKYVKFAYVEGYGPDYVGGENEDPSQRVLISRDESARSLQDRNMCAKFLEMAGKGRTFEMVCLPNTNRRLLTSLALIVVLGLDIVLYCYVLP